MALLEPARADELLVWLVLVHASCQRRFVVGGAVGVGAVAELVERASLGAGGEEEGGDSDELHDCCVFLGFEKSVVMELLASSLQVY